MGRVTSGNYHNASLLHTSAYLVVVVYIENMKNNKEEGEASIFVELKDGNIIIKHGTDKVVLWRVMKAKAGSWDKLWATIKSLQSYD